MTRVGPHTVLGPDLPNEAVGEIAATAAELRFIATAIATTEQIPADQEASIVALVPADGRSLDIHDSAQSVAPILADLLAKPDVAEAALELVRPCYTREDTVSFDVVKKTLKRAERELPPAPPIRAADLYDVAFPDPVTTAHTTSSSPS